MSHSTRAVIDVGSNSVVLSVARAGGLEEEGSPVEEATGPPVWKPFYGQSQVTGLGSGVQTTGLLSEEPMARTLEVIRDFWTQAERQGASQIVAIGTMALRLARNADEFRRRAEAQGTPVSVISGQEEARLGLSAALEDPSLKLGDRVTIIDPGGQSTEITTAERVGGEWQVRFQRSMPIGTLAVRPGMTEADTLDGLQVLQLTSALDSAIGFCYLPGACGDVVVLGSGGTHLIQIREKLTSWQPERIHASTLLYEEVSKAVGWLAPMGDANRAALPGVEPGVERTIHVAALILERCLFAVRAERCTVSIHGWRQAMFSRM